jgi:hypothetical protein
VAHAACGHHDRQAIWPRSVRGHELRRISWDAARSSSPPLASAKIRSCCRRLSNCITENQLKTAPP